jgi:hypothetical protein
LRRSGAVLLTDVFLRVMQVGGHDVFEQHGVTGASGGEGEPAAERACSDDGYGRQFLRAI